MTQKPYNPFEHHHPHGDHDHDHDHDHGVAVEETLDPAQQSLADALRVSFFLLKLLMVALIGVYLFTGVFNVPANMVAMRLQFGRILGESTSDQVLQPGGPYFAWPYPVQQVVYIPTAAQQIDINDAYWFEIGERDAGKTTDELAQGRQGPLNPEKDGSLLTGDANIVHAKWSITYRIARPVDYIRSIGDPQRAAQIVRHAAEQGIVFGVANLTADALIRGQVNRETTMRHIQQTLDAMKSGIEVQQLSVAQTAVPLSTREAFQSVINAENDKAQQIERAQQERARILGETAGEAYSPLLEIINAYELARQKQDEQTARELEGRIDQVMISLNLGPEHGNQAIGGRVSEVINEAITYRTQIVEQVRSEAETFGRLLPLYQQNPRIVRGRLWQDTKEQVLTGDVETIYLPPGQPYIEINRDPAVQRKREQQRLQAEPNGGAGR